MDLVNRSIILYKIKVLVKVKEVLQVYLENEGSGRIIIFIFILIQSIVFGIFRINRHGVVGNFVVIGNDDLDVGNCKIFIEDSSGLQVLIGFIITL